MCALYHTQSFGYESKALASLLPGTDLTKLQAIRDSKQYRVRLFTREHEGATEVILLLGETHTKNSAASEIGKDFLKAFRGDIGVEGVVWDRYLLGPQIRPIIYGLHDAVGRVAFGSGRKETTIKDAMTMKFPDDPGREVVRLEAHHVPDLMENASLLILSTMVVRTGVELAYRGSKLVITTGSSIYAFAKQPPQSMLWKMKLALESFWTPTQKLKSISVKEQLANLSEWAVNAPARLGKYVVNYPGQCKEAVLNFFFLSSNDPTRSFPMWKRLAIRADNLLKYSFTSLMGANVYLYFNPEIPVGLTGKRNSEMVAEGVSHLDEQEEPRPLMVIMGMAHLKGWAKLLEKKGFQELDFNLIERNVAPAKGLASAE